MTELKVIIPNEQEEHLEEAVEAFLAATGPTALTGAGISVESGIPDFRSPGGLWSIFLPDEYATIQVFLEQPEKAWQLYRAMGESLEGRSPNPAHTALADLEKAGCLKGLVTQNVDGLHQAGGSKEVIEIHGDHQHLQCIQCKRLEEVKEEHMSPAGEVPRCKGCGFFLKPNVVLFGEAVRGMERISDLLEASDLLLVIGTSAQVYPAAGLPAVIKAKGGLLFEFNCEDTVLTTGREVHTDFLFMGNAGETVPLLAQAVIRRLKRD